MEEMLKLMNLYSIRHNINNGIVLLFYNDESGGIYTFPIIHLKDQIFEFDSIKDLKQKLQQ